TNGDGPYLKLDLCRLFVVIDHHDNSSRPGRPRIRVLLLRDVEIHKASAFESIKLSAKCRETFDIFEQLPLVFGATRGRESVSFVARKSAGKVAARSWFVFTFHPELVAVVKLRHAARRQHKCIR